MSKQVFVNFLVEISGMLFGEEAEKVAAMEPKQAAELQEKRIDNALKGIQMDAKIDVKRVYMSVDEFKEYAE